MFWVYVWTGDEEGTRTGSGSIAAGVIVALILVAVLIGVVFYYRRRVKDIKTELAQVQYIADPLSRPGM